MSATIQAQAGASKKATKGSKTTKAAKPYVLPTDRLENHTAYAFMGYGKVNLTYQVPGDQAIEVFDLQRDISQEHVNTLYELGDGESEKNLRREDPETAMVFMVKSAYIKQSSLVRDAGGSYKEVQYTTAAKDQGMTVVDGCHRMEVVKKILKGTVDKLNKLLEKDSANLSGDHKIEHDWEVERLNKLIKEKGFWLVKFYDADKIAQSPTPQATLLALTGANNIKVPLQNTPSHVFRLVMVRLAQCQTEDDKNLAIGFAETLVNSSCSMEVKRIFSKGEDILELFCDLYKYQGFMKLDISPKDVLTLHHGAWGIFNAIVSKQWLLLKFLASDLPIPPAINKPDQSWELYSHLQTSLPTAHISKPLLNSLLNLFNSAFHHHFTPIDNFINLFGTNDPSYLEQLNSSLDWITERLVICKNGLTKQGDLDAFDLVLKKVPLLFRKGLAYGPGLIPPFLNGFPLLCPLSFMALMQMLTELDLSINVIATMVTPALGTVFGSKGGKSTTNIHYTSLSGGIHFHLAHALGKKNPIVNWLHTTKHEMQKTSFGDHSGGYYLDKAWQDIIITLLSHRSLHILPYTIDLQVLHSTCPWKRAGSNKTKSQLKANECLMSLAKDLVSGAIAAWPAPRSSQSERWITPPAGPIVQAFKAKGSLGCSVGDALSKVPFNFLHPVNNKVAYQNRLCKDLLQELEWKKEIVMPWLEDEKHMPFLWLLHQIKDTVQSNPGFQDFDFALKLPNLPETYKPVEVMDEQEVKLAMWKRTAQEKRIAFDRTWSSFAKKLTGQAGVKIKQPKGKDISKLHPLVAMHLKMCYKSSLKIAKEVWKMEIYQEEMERREEEEEDELAWEKPVHDKMLDDWKEVKLNRTCTVDWNEASLSETMLFFEIDQEEEEAEEVEEPEEKIEEEEEKEEVGEQVEEQVEEGNQEAGQGSGEVAGTQTETSGSQIEGLDNSEAEYQQQLDFGSGHLDLYEEDIQAQNTQSRKRAAEDDDEDMEEKRPTKRAK
ncbi:hypothetical protein EST38_g9638 [Candolleomyces aberdarensis]|uniref:Uncharacterized protein n=1 Tax=Candolleomyces aberdarensis TaxID=2316362 RepID=A0A4Q2DBS2_9AGAR|nr:hypothetical protein EST38_g9638 [Candolleomyces aberdarensis]